MLSHCHGNNSHILDTTVESFDMHFAVNARASWLLVREFGRRFRAPFGRGRIVALTSDHVAGNLPYGASKGALDRIILAAAEEFRDLGIAANLINPGPTDTGWMTAQQIAEFTKQTPGGRPGLPDDCANLVRFLCSEEGGWIYCQLLHSYVGLQCSRQPVAYPNNSLDADLISGTSGKPQIENLGNLSGAWVLNSLDTHL